MADRGPVEITSHGRTELVVLNPADFTRLLAGGGQSGDNLEWKLSIVLDTIETNVLILDDDMIVRRANRSLCLVIESTEAEILGKHVSSLVAHPSDRYLLDRLAEVHRSRVGEVLMFPSSRNVGRTLQMTLQPWPGGVVIFCDDITERSRAGDLAMAAEATDASLAALDGLGSVQVQSCGTILSTGMGLARMTGTAPGSLIGSRVQNLFPVHFRAIVTDALLATQGGARRHEVEYIRNGVTSAPATIVVTPYWSAEHHACAAVALHDPHWTPA